MIQINESDLEFMRSCSLGPEDIHSICTIFGIGKLKQIHKHLPNTVNANFLIESESGLYVAKFVRSDVNRIYTILKTLILLHKNGVPVLIPLQAIDKNHFVVCKSYMVQLTPYIQAIPFSIDSQQMFYSGAVLKDFHRALRGYDKVSKPKASIYPSTTAMTAGLNRLNDLQNHVPTSVISHIHHLYEKIILPWENISKGLPQTVIHGDWNERNMLFHGDGRVACIFDFDYIQRRERLFDVAYALWNFFNHPTFQFLNEPFMKGYGHMTEHEKHVLHHAIARVSFFFICTASLSQNPVHEVNHILQGQQPLIDYILSEKGKREINRLCHVYKTN